jgi:hypothetical protein
VRGDVVEALRIVPALELKFTQPLYLAKENEDLHLSLNIKVNSNKPINKGVLNLMYNGERLGGTDVNSQWERTYHRLRYSKTKLAQLIHPFAIGCQFCCRWDL